MDVSLNSDNTPAVADPDSDSASTADAPPAISSTLGQQRRLRRALRALMLLAWVGVILSGLWLAVAFGYPQDLRETRRPLMALNYVGFMGQVLHYLIGLACLTVAAGALMFRRWALLLVSLLVGLPATVPEWLTYRAKSPPPAAGETLRIASVNIFHVNQSPHYIFPELDRADADVILFQEWENWHEQFVTPRLADEYPHQVRFAHFDVRGMAVFSKRPLLETTPPGVDYRLSEHGMRLQRVVVEHEGHPLAIYNVHPAAPSPKPARAGRVLWGQRQLAELIDAVHTERIPFVLAGDFNAATHTSNLDALEAIGMSEVHALAGRGRGDTWPKRTWKRRLPGFRIDHIFLPPELTATRAEVGRYHGSDHLGIFADIGWRRGGSDENDETLTH